ncbi:something about silencing, SAS, complex subunit 4-domain-containing protein [Dipodascopsis tothii]|uniref:something about silencing, SAS, complex subunit 4-domain-containing protein n=1 Tax=Dipodascopsis tothii TaxID=44089 RepID=UPI0034CECC75
MHEQESPSRRRRADDPLPDSKYVAFMRRREREEKRTRNIERDKIMYEKLRLERQLDCLSGPEWTKAVTTMVRVDDPKDDAELASKRDWLIGEVRAVLDRFDRYKIAERRLREGTLDETVVVDPADKIPEPDSSEQGDPPELKLEEDRLCTPEPVRPSFYNSPGIRSRFVDDDRGTKRRRSGRRAMALGQPVPQLESRTFELPEWSDVER